MNITWINIYDNCNQNKFCEIFYKVFFFFLKLKEQLLLTKKKKMNSSSVAGTEVTPSIPPGFLH